jgi:hypothetical protein
LPKARSFWNRLKEQVMRLRGDGDKSLAEDGRLGVVPLLG